MSATFVYRALDPRGGELSGEVSGESKAAVAGEVLMPTPAVRYLILEG